MNLNERRLFMLSPEDVCSCHRPEVPGLICAGMPQHWFYAGQLKFAQDDSSAVMDLLDYKLWDIAVKMAVRLNWKTRKDDVGKSFLRKMAQLALFEMNAPARFNAPDAWQLRAAFMGVKKSQWFAVWSGRYKVLFDELNEWTNRAFRYIKIRKRKELREAGEMVGATLENEERWMEIMFERVA